MKGAAKSGLYELVSNHCCFKCLCRNVVTLPTLLPSLVPWAATNILHGSAPLFLFGADFLSLVSPVNVS